MGDRPPGIVRARGRVLRFILAATLATVGAFWFAADFSSSHAANPGGIVAGVGGTSTAAAKLSAPEAASHQPWFLHSALGTVLVGGAIPDPPFAPVLAVAGLYFLGRTWFERWSIRR